MYVVATAGHVDHGKSTLIRALTRMEPDRWAEERRRGMTIDLGYAWTDLPTGERIAFVDVPGHERFVTNMLAGVGQVPAVMLVIAADEGWRQQTTEHFDALIGFGVDHLVAVITRSDLADPARATEETRERLIAAGFADAETVCVSGDTGSGLSDLQAALGRLVARLPDPDLDGSPRLWVDRSFTIQGAGTVVTGTLVSGRLAVGDGVEIAPTGRRAAIRGIESCKEKYDEISAVARVAVNLRGVSVDDVSRGQLLVTPGSCAVATALDVELSKPLAAGQRTLHLGSATVACRVRPLGAAASRYCRLTLAAPLPVRLNDRGLLRDPASHTAVGIVIKDIDPPSFRRRGEAGARAEQLAEVGGPTTAADIVSWRGWVPTAALLALGADLDATVRVVGDIAVASAQWQEWAAALAELAADAADGVPLESVLRRTRIPDATVLAALLETVSDIESDGARIRRRGIRRTLGLRAARALTELEQRLAATPFVSPDAEELRYMGLDGATLAAAVAEGKLCRISADIYLLPDVADRAVERLRELPGPFTVAQARDALQSTRRVTVPLLQHLDAARRTERVDDVHRRLIR